MTLFSNNSQQILPQDRGQTININLGDPETIMPGNVLATIFKHSISGSSVSRTSIPLVCKDFKMLSDRLSRHSETYIKHN